MTNFLSSPLSKNVLILPSFLKDTLLGMGFWVASSFHSALKTVPAASGLFGF